MEHFPITRIVVLFCTFVVLVHSLPGLALFLFIIEDKKVATITAARTHFLNAQYIDALAKVCNWEATGMNY